MKYISAFKQALTVLIALPCCTLLAHPDRPLSPESSRILQGRLLVSDVLIYLSIILARLNLQRLQKSGISVTKHPPLVII